MDTADTQQTAAATAAHALPPAYSLLPTTTSTITSGSGHPSVSPAAVASSDRDLTLASTVPLPAYDDHEHGDSDASALASSDDKKSRAAVSPPDTTMVTHYVLETDTLPGLSLKYNVPIDAIRRANSLFSDTTLPARSKLFIPSPSSSSSSLSPTPPATDERKRLVKRFQLVAKCIDADEAWSYMRQNEFMLEQALEQWWADVKWERENGAAAAAAARRGGQLNSTSSSSSSGKWKKGMGL
ncbi:hypothetical protein BDZ88DRAFT_58524 [Geranomyces variabilis]|nr:hypothetical protein BDZ88DRAFT_58524 [Geranomyces variabilis]KAJ3133867.1 hypothetical protein HDU90_005475 [Geranomyces variabilis]